jgi:probable phosphoglycerate mutase
MLTERIAPVLADLTRDTVIVSHGGVARALLRLLCDLPEKEAPIVDIWQNKVLVFEAGGHVWA